MSNPALIDRAMSGAAGAPLSNTQKRRICQAARLAFGAQHARGLAGGDFDAWRHEEQFKACHHEHLTTATNAHYPALMARFLWLAGRPEAARRMQEQAALDPRRIAEAKFEQALAEAEREIDRPREYAVAIARCKFKTMDLDDLTPRQLWVLVFDLRRAAQKRRAHHAAHG